LDAAGARVAVPGQRLGLRDPAVSQRLDDFKNLGPGRERPGIGPLVFVNSHDELKLLVGHLPLLGCFTLIAAAPAGTSHPVQAQTPVYDALAAFIGVSAIREIRIVRVAAKVALTSVGEIETAILSNAAFGAKALISFWHDATFALLGVYRATAAQGLPHGCGAA
jgi:hypothetical protein